MKHIPSGSTATGASRKSISKRWMVVVAVASVLISAVSYQLVTHNVFTRENFSHWTVVALVVVFLFPDLILLILSEVRAWYIAKVQEMSGDMKIGKQK